MADSEKLSLTESLQVIISDDKMQAFLVFKRVEGDYKLNGQELEQYLSAQGIKYGLQSDTIYLIVQRPQDFYFSQNIIAVGTAPQPGQDGYINVLYGRRIKRISVPWRKKTEA